MIERLDSDFENKYYELKNDLAEDYLSSEINTTWGDYALIMWYEDHDDSVYVELVDTDEQGRYGTKVDRLSKSEFLNMDFEEFNSFVGQLNYYGTFEYDD